MSDYLDNLLARNTTPQEGVRPRPVSLFEPLPGAPWVPEDSYLGLEATEDEPGPGERMPGSQESMEPAAERPPAAQARSRPDEERRGLNDTAPARELRDGPPGPQSSSATALHPAEVAAPEPPRAQAALPLTAPAAAGEVRIVPSSPALRPGPAGPRRLLAPPLPGTDGTPSGSPRIQAAPAPAQPAPSLPPEAPVRPRPARAAEPMPQPPGTDGTQATTTAIPPVGDNAPHESTDQGARPALAPVLERTVIERIVPRAPQPPIPEDRSRRERGQENRAVAPALPPPGAAIRVVPAEIVARPQVRPAPAPTPSPSAPPAAGPEPTIQVTIGRIEVRATQAPAPPRRPPPRAPALSLEDYMRRRSGGA